MHGNEEEEKQTIIKQPPQRLIPPTLNSPNQSIALLPPRLLHAQTPRINNRHAHLSAYLLRNFGVQLRIDLFTRDAAPVELNHCVPKDGFLEGRVGDEDYVWVVGFYEGVREERDEVCFEG